MVHDSLLDGTKFSRKSGIITSTRIEREESAATIYLKLDIFMGRLATDIMM